MVGVIVLACADRQTLRLSVPSTPLHLPGCMNVLVVMVIAK